MGRNPTDRAGSRRELWCERPSYYHRRQLAGAIWGISVNGTIVRTLDQVRRSLPELALGQAWQSDQALHKLEDFGELVSCVNDTVTNVLEFLKIGCDACEITGFWANISATGAGHRMHSHPNNFFSGVYYVQTRAGSDFTPPGARRLGTDIVRFGDWPGSRRAGMRD